jgi:uncharacterized membrane protein YhhN
MKKSGISIIYFIVGILFIIVQNHSSFCSELIIKALIIPLLMILFFVKPNPFIIRLNYFMFAGLFFSWAGDVILEFSKRNGSFFIYGLVCFLLTHIIYSIAFFSIPRKHFIKGNRIYLLIPVLTYGVVLVSFLYSDLSEMRLPVILYSIVILTMLTGVINLKESVNRGSYNLILGGAILFVLSDSIIAFDKFSQHFESSDILIMSTYILAQYLIITGYLSIREH